MIDAIICDWNGTIFEDRYEEKFFKGLAKKIALSYPNCINVYKMINFLKTKRLCEKIFEVNKETQNKVVLKENILKIINLLNTNIFKGIKQNLLLKYTDSYAKKASKRLDKRILDTIFEFKEEKKILLGIISSGYKEGIKKTLEYENYHFDFVIANDFNVKDSKIEKFNLSIFDNKKEILSNLVINKKKILLERIVYVGDDWQDQECFEKVGHPIVSFYADEKFRNSCHKTTDVFIPKNAMELKAYLMKII